MKNKIVLLCLLVSQLTAFSQNETSKWYFGTYCGLDFMTSPPTILTNGQLSTTEGCASMADAAGNLLFYTDGVTIYDKNHTAMANGTGLTGNASSTQSGVIVKQPGNSNIYFVVTQGSSLCYSIVDMNLAAPNGSVTTKNSLLFNTGTEKLTSVRHCNGVDIWILSHDGNSNNFRAYLITASGINTVPVNSPIGSAGAQDLGYLKVSPNGKKIGNAIWDSGILELLDFDNSTGIVTNPLVLKTGFTYAYGCEFSPDGSKLYAGQELSTTIFQWDLCAGSTTAVVASQNTVGIATAAEVGAFQLHTNGKIYVAKYNEYSLGVIDNPNVYGTGCNFINMGPSTGTAACQLGLPNFFSSFFKPVLIPFTYSATCANVTFTAPPSSTVNLGCSAIGNAITSRAWSFGEPSSGAANSSTVTNPSHSYSTAGTYTVQLVLYGQCTSDTIRVPVTINGATNLNVTGNFTVCARDKRTYTVSGASTYTWNGGLHTATVSLSPTVTTVYSVTGTGTNSCAGSKQFTITVNKCTGIDQAAANLNSLKIFPNPASSQLTIETENFISLKLINQFGKAIFEGEFEAGTHTLDMSRFSDGIYTLQYTSKKTTRSMRLVKME